MYFRMHQIFIYGLKLTPSKLKGRWSGELVKFQFGKPSIFKMLSFFQSIFKLCEESCTNNSRLN